MTVERAKDLPGRFADAARFKEKLLATRAGLAARLDHLKQQAAISAAAGQEFLARRTMAEAVAVQEEIDHLDALFVELDRIIRRLRRQERLAEHRLQTFTFGDTKQFEQAR